MEKQQFKRQTAIKVHISDLTTGKWEQKDGLNFLISKSGEEIGRVRILATVVSKFISEDGNFASITLDDGTETIRVKGWKDIKNLEDLSIGSLVDLIGKIREYNDETYITNEIVQIVEDPNLETLRMLELLAKAKKQVIVEKPTEEFQIETLRDSILKMIEESESGIEYIKIVKNLKVKAEDAEAIIDDLLSGGICYEPTPGVIKKI